ncbi:MAG TPA: hypothetical protein VI078_01530, partial [bacterium]
MALGRPPIQGAMKKLAWDRAGAGRRRAKLDKPIWQLSGIETFTQRELNYGQPSSEKTKVVVFYNKTSLYFGISCYMHDASQIRTKFMQRDFDYS